MDLPIIARNKVVNTTEMIISHGRRRPNPTPQHATTLDFEMQQELLGKLQRGAADNGLSRCPSRSRDSNTSVYNCGQSLTKSALFLPLNF